MTAIMDIPAISSRMRERFESVFESALRLRLAKTLVQYADKEFTGRELARASRMSHTTASQALRALVEAGLASRKVIGPAYVYRANRDSYLFESIERLLDIEREIQRDLVEILQTKLRGVATSVTIFGSFAKGTPGPDSDLDVVVVASDAENVRERTESLVTLFLRRYGLRLSPHVLTRAEYAQKSDLPYLKAAREEGITIVGRPLSKVVS